MGTGDGLFLYNCARHDSQTFFIGIDANRRPLEKVSHKIYRKPAKGGLPNLLFLQASADSLPDELTGKASEVHVNFPWGSLLRAVATGDESVLRNLRRICASDALLKVLIGLDPERDRSEIERLALPALSTDYVNGILVTKYRNAAFEIVETESLSSSSLWELHTSWARRLQSSNRSFMRITARAIPLR